MSMVQKIILLCLAMTAAGAHAEELGRLFFSPAERMQLEHNQQQNSQTPGDTRSQTVNGIVQKHGGNRTVWINGVPQAAGKSDERAPESLPVAIPGRPQPVRVKVGQKISTSPATPAEP